MSQGRNFRDLLMHEGAVACVGAYDAMTARLVQAAGAKAMYISGYAAAASALGYPDVGLVSQTEMAEHIRRICRVTELPVIADAWSDAGAAGLHLEDQVFPKKCGHIAGKAVIPVEEMLQKIKAACAARTDPNFYVIARTDAIAVTGMQDALERCKRFAEAGADALFVDAPESIEQTEQIARELEGYKSPFLSEKQLREFGFHIVLYPIEALAAALRAVKDVFSIIVREGSTDAVASRLASFSEINALVQLDAVTRREGAYR